jgi:hypothetical protein
MPDEPSDQEEPAAAPQGPAPAEDSASEPGDGQSPTSGVRRALAKRDARGRPVAVYAILGSVVAVLALLMIIIYFSDSQRTQPDQPICTTIDPARAEQDIREGEVERFTVGYDESAIAATDPAWGPVLARLDYLDGACAYLPQGLVNQTGIMTVIGTITYYNQTTDSAQVTLVYNQMADLDPSLFAQPTVALPDTPVPTEAPPAPTEVPAGTPTATPTQSPASPAASPAGTPVTSPTETSTATP